MAYFNWNDSKIWNIFYFLCQQGGISLFGAGWGGPNSPPPPGGNAGFCSKVCPDAEVKGLFIAIIVHHNWFTKQTIINYNFLTQSSLKFTLKLGVSIAKVFRPSVPTRVGTLGQKTLASLKSVRRWRMVQNESQLFGIRFKNTT